MKQSFIQLTTWEVVSSDLVAPLFWIGGKVASIMVEECGREGSWWRRGSQSYEGLRSLPG